MVGLAKSGHPVYCARSLPFCLHVIEDIDEDALEHRVWPLLIGLLRLGRLLTVFQSYRSQLFAAIKTAARNVILVQE